MATIKQVVGSPTMLTETALDSLASATFVTAGTIDVSADDPLDVLIEVAATPGTVASNKQLVVYAKASTDNSGWTTGPGSGTSTTDEPNLYQLGTLPLGSNATSQMKIFSVAAALGFVPPYIKIVIKNETGVALAASGSSVYYTLVSGSVA